METRPEPVRLSGRGGGDSLYGLGGNDTLFGDSCGAGGAALPLRPPRPAATGSSGARATTGSSRAG